MAKTAVAIRTECCFGFWRSQGRHQGILSPGLDRITSDADRSRPEMIDPSDADSPAAAAESASRLIDKKATMVNEIVTKQHLDLTLLADYHHFCVCN